MSKSLISAFHMSNEHVWFVHTDAQGKSTPTEGIIKAAIITTTISQEDGWETTVDYRIATDDGSLYLENEDNVFYFIEACEIAAEEIKQRYEQISASHK